MYSGITQGLFPVVHCERLSNLLRYGVQLSASLIHGLQVGASVNINGVCQTVVAVEAQQVVFEAMQATLAITTLNFLQLGDRVSVERSLKVGDELGGHEMAGHVLGMVTLKARSSQPNALQLTFACDPAWIPYILPKGFIAVDGSSLTVADSKPEGEFSVHLIPETLRRTNFLNKQVGDLLNLELDHRTRTVVDTLRHSVAIA